MNPICAKYVRLVLICLAAAAPSALCAENLQSYHNQEFGFSFHYPGSWVIRPASVPNLQVKVGSPDTTQPAECAVIVKRYPHAVSAKQSDIDQIFTEVPTPAELKDVLSQGANEVEVVTASAGTLHKRPAHWARVRYSVDTSAGKVSASGRVVMTATPGLTWTVSCSAQGDTPAKAEQSFQFWKKEIDSLIASFRFN